MKSIQLTTETGYTWITSVNSRALYGTIESYFLGMSFNIGTGSNVIMDQVTTIKYL